MSNYPAENHVIPMVVTEDAARDFALKGKVSQIPLGGVPHLVHYVPCSNDVYTAYMQPLNKELKADARAKRCPVPGKSRKIIRCPDENNCSNCPYGYDPDSRKPFLVSFSKTVVRNHRL